MIKSYRYTIEGSAADGQTWTTTGDIRCQFHVTLDVAMKDSFDQLTKGRAVYGKPGVGCEGPYDVLRVVIEQVYKVVLTH